MTTNESAVCDAGSASSGGGWAASNDNEWMADGHPGNAEPPLTPVERLRQELLQLVHSHRIWENPLLRDAEEGSLSRDDYQYLFTQYNRYSRSFTQYLCAIMAQLPNPKHRAEIAENLFEELGLVEGGRSHQELYQEFLTKGLDLHVDQLVFEDYTEFFVSRFLGYCATSHPWQGAIFLAYGTEEIVPRLYRVFINGLRRAGVPDKWLEFLYVHVHCDHGHAESLWNIAKSFSEVPGWEDCCREAVCEALDLRDQFFTQVHEASRLHRLRHQLARVQARESLALPNPEDHRFPCTGKDSMVLGGGELLYHNHNERLNIEFHVHRLPFRPEIMDPRLLRIPPGRNNELHKHAHEAIFYVIEGEGVVRIDDHHVAVKAGDCVFVPRWVMHQTTNTGGVPLVILAITDFEFTRKAFVGKYNRSARAERSNNASGLTGILAEIEFGVFKESSHELASGTDRGES